MPISQLLDQKYAQVRAQCAASKRALVAFSGGVDSTLLAKIAYDVLGDNAIAVTADSESMPRREFREAEGLAREIGIRLEVVRARELDNADYAENSPRRCYFCKAELFDQMEHVSRETGIDVVMYGANADDVGDYRPGMEAAGERGVFAPLLEAGITKDEARVLSRELGLRTWDKAAFACLSSRFPHGTAITREKLAMVDAAEDCLHVLGFRQFRVRHHEEVDGANATARIEVPVDEMARFLDPQVRAQVNETLDGLGYRFIALDLQGYRSGSLNPDLLEIESPRLVRQPESASLDSSR